MLEIKNISKTYKTGSLVQRALDNVSFSVNKGEFVAIVGTSGSGKSTLLNMLGGLDRPTSGSVIIDGKSIFDLKDEELILFKKVYNSLLINKKTSLFLRGTMQIYG